MVLGGEAYAKGTRWIDDPVTGLSMVPPRMGTDLEYRPTLTGQELYTVRVIALVSASASIVSGVVVGWWFVRMKRSFRHHLIMLMIFSDFFKASWQLIYPAIVFSQGAVTSDSMFCQISGFMMSMGIEASDFAVLAIAVHSALYIFRPGMGAIGEGGLFRYRYYVYAAWLCFAIVMPSLAFINDDFAYSAQGTYCYLPVRPFWYRLTLAWIPRYLILLTIIILYAAIYIYVRLKFRTFRLGVGGSTLDLDSVDLATIDNAADHGRFPSLDVHGLIPPPSPGLEPRHQFPDSPSPLLEPSPRDPSFSPAFLSPYVDKPSTSNSSTSNSSTSNSNTSNSNTSSNTSNSNTSNSAGPAGSAGSAGRRTSCSPTRSRRSSPIDHDLAEKARELSEQSASEELRRRRMAISRQLRLLFIYPIVYALMWVPPLVSHSLQFTDRFLANPSFLLHCVVAFTLPFQCFVNCWLFTIREKPWRYIPDTRRSNWYARYGFWFGKCKGRSTEKGAEDGGDSEWRHRKHMSFEARKAYERRDVERLDAVEEWVLERKRVGERRAREAAQRESERSWWDVAIDNAAGSSSSAVDGETSDEDETGRGGEVDELSGIEDQNGTAAARVPAQITITPPSDYDTPI